ncbi:hypothetical protein PJI17_32325, partial [Mycobacterium kansasii]
QSSLSPDPNLLQLKHPMPLRKAFDKLRNEECGNQNIPFIRKFYLPIEVSDQAINKVGTHKRGHCV